jgi:uncharacterized membrane protein
VTFLHNRFRKAFGDAVFEQYAAFSRPLVLVFTSFIAIGLCWLALRSHEAGNANATIIFSIVGGILVLIVVGNFFVKPKEN